MRCVGRSMKSVKNSLKRPLVWRSLLSVTGCGKSPEKIAEMTNLLFDAITSGDVEQAKLYIKGGANVNAKKGEKGITPLISSVQKNSNEMVALLIKSKADINILDANDRSPLIWALVTRRDYRQDSDLKKNTDILEQLIREGADVNAKDKYDTVFGYAVGTRYSSILSLLIEAGADISILDKNTLSRALMVSATSGNKDLSELFIKSGADVDARDASSGWTIIMNATLYKGTEGVIKLLIESGADVNARSDGSTALDLARTYGTKEVVEVLKAAGAK